MKNNKEETFYDILGLDEKCSPEDIKKAYRKLSRLKHPDKNPDNPEAVNEFIQITKAYTVSQFFIFFNFEFCLDYD
jgi:molecular chaperone DnaJ